MKTVHVKYYADTAATQLLTDYDTREEATAQNLQSWKEWMEDGATEHPEEPEKYSVYDVTAE